MAWVSLVVSVWLAEALVTACPPGGGCAGGAVHCAGGTRLIGPRRAPGRPPGAPCVDGAVRLRETGMSYAPFRAPRRHYSLGAPHPARLRTVHRVGGFSIPEDFTAGAVAGNRAGPQTEDPTDTRRGNNEDSEHREHQASGGRHRRGRHRAGGLRRGAQGGGGGRRRPRHHRLRPRAPPATCATAPSCPTRPWRSCGASTPSSSAPSARPSATRPSRPGTLERGLLLRLRFELDLYVNLRPFTGVPGSIAEGADFVVVRENTEGTYAGEGGFLRKGTPHEVATQGSVNTRHGRRALRALRLRAGRSPPGVATSPSCTRRTC